MLQCTLIPRYVKLKEKMFYIKLDFLLDKYPRLYVLVVLGYFNAFIDTERACYEICVGPHGSVTRNENKSF